MLFWREYRQCMAIVSDCGLDFFHKGYPYAFLLLLLAFYFEGYGNSLATARGRHWIEIYLDGRPRWDGTGLKFIWALGCIADLAIYLAHQDEFQRLVVAHLRLLNYLGP